MISRPRIVALVAGILVLTAAAPIWGRGYRLVRASAVVRPTPPTVPGDGSTAEHNLTVWAEPTLHRVEGGKH